MTKNDGLASHDLFTAEAQPRSFLRNILWSTDFSAPSEISLPFAAALARRFEMVESAGGHPKGDRNPRGGRRWFCSHLDRLPHLCCKKGLHEHDLPILWSHPEFTNGGSSAHTNQGAMPEVLEPPVARAKHAGKSVASKASAIGVEDARS